MASVEKPIPPDVELDLARYELRRHGRVERLEKLPMELLILLAAERPGQLVARSEILDRLWGKDVFVDADAAINTAVRKVRRALGDDPDSPRFLETVVGKGYRFVGPIVVIPGSVATPKAPDGSVPRDRTPVSRRRALGSPSRRGLVAGAVVAVLVLALGGVWVARRGRNGARPSTSSSASKRIAVLPFENLGAAEDGYFADGMTDEVRSKLAVLSGLAVIASASASQYKATSKPPEQIARELGVGYLLFAKVRWQKSGQVSRIRLTSELVELGGGGAPTTRWQEAYEADLSDVFRVQAEIATKVAQSLEVALTGKERGRLAVLPTSNLAAYDAYLKGQETEKEGFNPAALRRAAAQYEQAVALDPAFPQAWARLSVSRSGIYAGSTPSLQDAEAARKAAERALELAPGIPDGHLALGDYYEWVKEDHEKALEAYARGMRVSPDDALLLQASAVAERNLGRWEEALAQLRRARELDPRSWEVEGWLGTVLMALRRTAEAREALDRGLVLAPANLNLIHLKATTFLQEGELARARAALAATPRAVEPAALLALVASSDRHWVLDDAHRDVVLRLTPAAFDGDRGVWGIVLAQASAWRGDQAKAREYAEEARKDFAADVAEFPQDGYRRAQLCMALAYLGRHAEAVRERERVAALLPMAKDPLTGRYVQHQLVRIHILAGNHEKALDLLEPLLKVPYVLTPAWLRIDPNFDPLRGNPRFEELARGASKGTAAPNRVTPGAR